GEVVSDQAALFMMRVTSSPTSNIPIVPPRPLFVFRLDSTVPSVPGKPVLVPPAATAFHIQWDPATHNVSDLNGYHAQDGTGADPRWRTISFTPAKRGKFVNNLYQQSPNTSYRVGAASVDNPGETARAPGFYSYRVRAYNTAGLNSDWSPESASIQAGS